jgi:hypothetical protein
MMALMEVAGEALLMEIFPIFGNRYPTIHFNLKTIQDCHLENTF